MGVEVKELEKGSQIFAMNKEIFLKFDVLKVTTFTFLCKPVPIQHVSLFRMVQIGSVHWKLESGLMMKLLQW